LIKTFTGNWEIFGISSTGGRAPEYRLSPDRFQTVKRMLATDWAQKILCITVPNRRTASLEFFSCVRTRRLLCLTRYPGALPFSTRLFSRRDWLPLGLRGCIEWDPLCVNWNREEKLLRHVSMVAKFLDDSKPKTSLTKWIRPASNFIDLIQFQLIWQMLAKFSRAESERTESLKFRKEKKDNFCVVFTYSMKRGCEIRKFHVAGVQRRQRNVQNSVMHVQICCFVNKNLLLVCHSPFIAVVVGFVVIQKSWVLPWWRDVILFLSIPLWGCFSSILGQLTSWAAALYCLLFLFNFV